MDSLLLLARLLLSAVFVVAGIAKVADRSGSRESLVSFGLPPSLAAPFGTALPVVELAIAAALIVTDSSWWGALAALALLLLFAAAVGLNLAKGRRPACNCFGSLASAPISGWTLLRNLGLAAIAVFIMSGGWITAQWSVASVSEVRVTNVQVAALALIAFAFASLLAAQGWLILRLRQRLDALETKLHTVGVAASSASAPSAMGLPLGTRAPAFRLTGLEGESITLDNLRGAGKPIVLVFSDPGCSPCTQLLPALGRWQSEHAAQLSIVNISRGSLDANRANSMKFGLKHVLLQQAGEVNLLYQAHMAPSALVVRADGTIGSALALGESAISALVESTLAGTVHGQLHRPNAGVASRSLAAGETP